VDDEPPPPPLGDETDIFLSYHPVLRRKLTRAVNTSEANLDDACAIAWVQFLRKQPDRTDNRHEAWLFVVAKHEAIRLHREQSGRYFTVDPEVVDWQVDPRDPHEESAKLREAIDILGRLPLRDRRVAFLKAMGHTYADIGELTGKSPRMTDRVIRRANERIHEVLSEKREAEQPHPSPRATSLAALELEQPEWLANALGSKPGKRAPRYHIRRWRMAAIAIDDYRRMSGFNDRSDALGPRPDDLEGRRAHEKATRLVETYHRARERGRGFER
jgi:RNA polymerase sigma factor (sigma-70 family)